MDQQLKSFEFDELLARCIGNLDFAQRLLSRFEGRLEDDLAELAQQIASGDTPGVARVAHRIKGASANISAPRLQAQAADVEDLARAHRLDSLPSCLERLREERVQFSSSVSSLRSPGETALDGTG